MQSPRRYWWGEGSGEPAACCIGTDCSELCPKPCAEAGGIFQGEGTSCSDTPSPCGSASCVTSDPFCGLVWDSGFFVESSPRGFPVTSTVTLTHVVNATGASTSDNLTLSDGTELVWNFAGTHDPQRLIYYYIGGRPGNLSAPPTVVTLDTAAASMVNKAALVPEMNMVDLEFDHVTDALYGLSVNGDGGMDTSDGHVFFAETLNLVRIDPDTGAVTIISPDLAGGLDHFAAVIDHEGGRYLYHTIDGGLHSVDLLTGAATVLNGAALPTGSNNWADAYDCENQLYLYVDDTVEAHVLDITTGNLVSSSPPPASGRLCTLD